jgi:acetylglutamate kinase
MLSSVLPDPYNLGYQEVRMLVVDQINGRKITKLEDVVQALKEPKDGVTRIQFIKGDTLQSLLLDAATLDEATQRVLKRYDLPADKRLGS